MLDILRENIEVAELVQVFYGLTCWPMKVDGSGELAAHRYTSLPPPLLQDESRKVESGKLRT